MKTILVISYLMVIVVANLVVTKFGAAALPLTALLLIPFDLIARDQLHELWTGNGLRLKMFILVVSGSLISFALNVNSKQIAIASCASFLLAGAADFVVYQLCHKKTKHEKMIYSNLVSGTLDSFVFQLIAFGSVVFTIALEQTFYKAFGTVIWTFLFVYFAKKLKK